MLLCTFSIFAQNKVITVSGRVVESDTKEPAAQATGFFVKFGGTSSIVNK